MERIKTINREIDKFGPGKDGFRAAIPGVSEPTYLSAIFVESLQEAIMRVQEMAGMQPSADHNQFANAISYLIDYAVAPFGETGGSNQVGYRGHGLAAVLRSVQFKFRESASFTDDGADGTGADQTARLQSAASARGNSGRGQSELTLPDGDFLISASASSAAIALNSDTLVRGTGGQLRADFQNFYMLWSHAKSNIRVDGVRLTAGSTAGNDAQAAIYASSGDVDCSNHSVTFNDIVDTSWAVLHSAEIGAGSFSGTRYIGNHVRSTVNGTKADGLHMAGRHYAHVAVGNSVRGRADAGLAMNMTGSHYGYGFTYSANASIDNLVGIDCSGSQYGVVAANVCFNTIDHAASNPCIRAIAYSGRIPQFLLINGNLALGKHAASGEVDIKVTTGGADSHSIVSSNYLRTFYTDARFVSLAGNTFQQGARININNLAGEITIGHNTFEGIFDLFGSGNAGEQGLVSVARQNWNRGWAPNFLPNYSAANPCWVGSWTFESSPLFITATAMATSSKVPVDVPNSMFVLRGPGIIAGISALADLATHSGYIQVTDLNNNLVCQAAFNVIEGAGGTNVACSLQLPAVVGNPYHAVIRPGTYKLRVFSVLNQMTLKCATLNIWS